MKNSLAMINGIRGSMIIRIKNKALTVSIKLNFSSMIRYVWSRSRVTYDVHVIDNYVERWVSTTVWGDNRILDETIEDIQPQIQISPCYHLDFVIFKAFVLKCRSIFLSINSTLDFKKFLS